MGPLGEFVDEEIDCSESPFDARNYIGTFGHIWPNGFFLLLMQGGCIYCYVPFLIGLKDTYMTICAPILVLNS